MSVFDLLFLALVLAALGSLVLAAVSALLGAGERAVRILRGLALGAALYLGAVASVSAVVPRRTVRVGETLRFDDWCISVEDVRRVEAPAGATVVLDLRLASRARGVTQRETGLLLSLRDASGRSYRPLAAPDEIPIDTPLAPGESVLTTRRFETPADARITGLVVAHGGFPIRWFLLGEGPFRAPPMVLLDAPSAGAGH